MDRPVRVGEAGVEEAAELAEVAAQSFPLACPPSVTPENITAFIAANLSRENFRAHLADPDRVVLAARADSGIIGYTLLIRGDGRPDRTVELSKMYVLPGWHGTGVAAALIGAALDRARGWGADHVWLGVNQGNARAQRFYAKHGFAVSGTRTFQVGAGVEQDFLMVCALREPVG